MFLSVSFSSYISSFDLYIAPLLQPGLSICRRYILKAPQNLECAVLGCLGVGRDGGGGGNERTEVSILSSFSVFFLPSPTEETAELHRLGWMNLDWRNRLEFGQSESVQLPN